MNGKRGNFATPIPREPPRIRATHPFSYKVGVLTDANHKLPLIVETRPDNASDVVVIIQNLDDCLAFYRTLSPRYFLGDKGYDK